MKKAKLITARIISRVFDPVIEIPVAIFLAIQFAITEGLRWRFLGLLLFVDMVVPFVFFLVMIFNKQISDWDVRKRSQRLPLYFFTMLCHLGGVWLAHELGKDELAAILSVFLFLGTVFSIVTAYWKISIHAGVNTVLIMVVNYFWGWQYWPLFLILPLVGWARIYDRHHTWKQYLAGVILAASITWVGMNTWAIK